MFYRLNLRLGINIDGKTREKFERRASSFHAARINCVPFGRETWVAEFGNETRLLSEFRLKINPMRSIGKLLDTVLRALEKDETPSHLSPETRNEHS